MPASLSQAWLCGILREQLGFQGMVFSDDLNMQGIAHVGGIVDCVTKAFDAGSDMLLLCNNRAAVELTLDQVPVRYVDSNRAQKFRSLLRD